MKKLIKNALPVVAMFGVAGVAFAGSGSETMTIDVTGANFWDFPGDDDNEVVIIDLGGPAVVTGIGFDVVQTSFGESFGLEAALQFSDMMLFDKMSPDLAVIQLRTNFVGGDLGPPIVPDPVIDENFVSDGIIDISDAGVMDLQVPSGMLRLEFVETFDDVPDEIDATYTGPSTITVEYDVESTGLFADLDNNGIVGGGDLLILLNAWGPCDGCPADLNGSGEVGGPDLLQLLNAWGTTA